MAKAWAVVIDGSIFADYEDIVEAHSVKRDLALCGIENAKLCRMANCVGAEWMQHEGVIKQAELTPQGWRWLDDVDMMLGELCSQHPTLERQLEPVLCRYPPTPNFPCGWGPEVINALAAGRWDVMAGMEAFMAITKVRI